ncbi:hypothetical protein DFJ58DRAFT_837745 [Suillus subalutaceus]|uniref:uncharacterized protein n=1 Tax=Suillus subalutaceus TaxID=48586 RepID=UPI001B86E2B1|nr:uncharacterized protein DFJ58DRAFT_837745 [Suillus subalutaceus]KAG1869450.1 hypothetical protein DFJ58DRAFT_837745 [Suillus subalutaceus]
MSEDHRLDSPPGASRSSRANAAESSNQPRRGIRQFLRKLKNALTKKLPRTSNRTTAVQNVETEGASSSQKVESFGFLRGAQDTLHLNPSDDNKHPTMSEIPGDSMNQGLSGEPVLQVQPTPPGEGEGANPKLVDAELQGASRDRGCTGYSY